MGYEAGNLELSILGFSEKAVASIDVTAKALRRLASAVDKINNTQFVFAGQKLEFLFTKIAKATNSINTTNITNLASAAKSLSSISRLSNLDKMDFKKVGKGFNTLAVAIQPFLDRVKEAEASLTALDGVLKRTSGKKIQGLLGGGATDNKKGGFLGFAKLGVNIYMMRRLGRFMANLVQAGSDYNETLNLWQVAMRNNLDVADQFINKMQKAYGISTKTLMNAQAVFKNMIGSLGQISDQTAYALSEALVQMSADYASLYNRTLESAFQNMQSMLAGQVRPIRSAGLDMTETTLFMFYQQLGGTKTMRQLNRTEKQLLSILAVYQQMGSAGALGDMSKTLNQFANQSRMMTEYWAELKTWSGLLLKDLLDQWQVLIYINAALITVTEIVKAIAKSRGIGDENFLTGLFETTDATNDAVDELQGKLLDFDKFRSLEGATASPLAIDEKLLQAISGYSSKIDQAQNAAQKLAKTWLEFWINEETGGLTEDADRVLDILEGLVKFTTILIGLKVGGWLLGFVKGITSLTVASKGLNTILLAGVIYVIWEAIDAFREGDTVAGIIAITIGVALVGALVAFKLAQNKAAIATQLLTAGIQQQNVFMQAQGLTMAKTSLAIKGVGVAIMSAVGAFAILDGVISGLDGTSRKTVSIISIVVGALATLLGVILAIKGGIKGGLIGASIAGLGVGALIAGIKGVASKEAQSLNNIPNYEMGASDIDSGTVFRAGEFGKTEAVYTGSNGKTNVANIQQMKTAYNQALKEWWATAKHDIPAFQGVSDSGIYTIVDGEARRRGKKFVNV